MSGGEGGSGGRGASIALLAGLNSSLRSFSCSHYKDSQRQRVGEQVTRGRKEKSPKEVKGSLVRWFSRSESDPGP